MKEINKLDKNTIMLFLKIFKLNRFYIILITYIILLPFSIAAQDTITLSQAVNSGLANKKNIVAGNLDLKISNLQTTAMYQKYLPQVSAEYNYLYNPILQTSIIPIGVFNPAYPADATSSVQFGTKWNQSAGITIIQPLLDLTIQKHVNEAKLQERIAALSQDQSEYDFAFSITQTYVNIYLHEAKIKSLISDTNRTYISYILLKNKFDEKRLLKSDLNKSKINHNKTVQLLTDAISELIQDKVYLLFLMGTKEIEKWNFSIDTSFSVNYLNDNKNYKINIAALPTLQKLTLQSDLAILQEKSERLKHIPTLSFKGFLGANQYSNTFDPAAANSWFGSSYVGLNVKIPILFGESTANKTEQLKIQSNQFILKKEDTELQYAKDAITAKINLQNTMAQLKIQAENIALSTESIDIFRARFAEGQESASNLNLEETSLQLMKFEYEANKKALWIYWLDYLKATGQLSILWK